MEVFGGSPETVGGEPSQEERVGDADDEVATLLNASQVVAVPRVYDDVEEAAEVAMMHEGLAKSQHADLRPSARSPAVFTRKGSVFFSSAADLLGPAAAAITPTVDAMELAEFTVLVRSLHLCLLFGADPAFSLRCKRRRSTTPSARAPRRC